MKKEDVIKLAAEVVGSIVVGVVSNILSKRMKEINKRENFENTPISDLTVKEFKEMMKGEA